MAAEQSMAELDSFVSKRAVGSGCHADLESIGQSAWDTERDESVVSSNSRQKSATILRRKKFPLFGFEKVFDTLLADLTVGCVCSLRVFVLPVVMLLLEDHSCVMDDRKMLIFSLISLSCLFSFFLFFCSLCFWTSIFFFSISTNFGFSDENSSVHAPLSRYTNFSPAWPPTCRSVDAFQHFPINLSLLLCMRPASVEGESK